MTGRDLAGTYVCDRNGCVNVARSLSGTRGAQGAKNAGPRSAAVQALAAWSLTLFFPPSDLEVRFPTSRYSDHGAGLEAPAACDSYLLTKERAPSSVVPRRAARTDLL